MYEIIHLCLRLHLLKATLHYDRTTLGLVKYKVCCGAVKKLVDGQ